MMVVYSTSFWVRVRPAPDIVCVVMLGTAVMMVSVWVDVMVTVSPSTTVYCLGEGLLVYQIIKIAENEASNKTANGSRALRDRNARCDGGVIHGIVGNCDIWLDLGAGDVCRDDLNGSQSLRVSIRLRVTLNHSYSSMHVLDEALILCQLWEAVVLT